MPGNDNDLNWITAGTAYSMQQTGAPTQTELFVHCTNKGTNDAGLVTFELAGIAEAKGVTITTPGAIEDQGGGVLVSKTTLTVPAGLDPTDTFSITATPVTANGALDGKIAVLGPCIGAVYPVGAGNSLVVGETFAKTPGDPTKPGQYYTISISVTGVEGAATAYSLNPPNNAKLYDTTGTELPSYVTGVYYVNTNSNGRAIARLATNTGTHLQYIELASYLVGPGTSASNSVYFAKTPDDVDLGLGWDGPTLPDAKNGVLNLPDVGTDYRIKVPINDPKATNVSRHVVVNDLDAFAVDFTATTTILRPDTELILDPTLDSNKFTVFSQDSNGSIVWCSHTNEYGVSGTPDPNLPDQTLQPRILPEALIDPDPGGRVLNRNSVNAHDGLGIKLYPITIADMGLSDLGNSFIATDAAMADTSVVFTFWMNGYEAPDSFSPKRGKYHNEKMSDPQPTLSLSADKSTLTFVPIVAPLTFPVAILKYAYSVGWYQNSQAFPPNLTCAFEYNIQQIQGGIINNWYSSLTSQNELPYTSSIPS